MFNFGCISLLSYTYTNWVGEFPGARGSADICAPNITLGEYRRLENLNGANVRLEKDSSKLLESLALWISMLC